MIIYDKILQKRKSDIFKILLPYNKYADVSENENAKTVLIEFYTRLQDIKIDKVLSRQNNDHMRYLLHMPKAYMDIKNKNYLIACEEITEMIYYCNYDGKLQLRDKAIILMTIEDGLKDEIQLKKKKICRGLLWKIRVWTNTRKSRISFERN